MTRTAEDRDAKIARLERELAEARARAAAAEAVSVDQRGRLSLLGARLEEQVRMLAATESELQRVTLERDALKLDRPRGDDGYSATVTLPEDYVHSSVYYGASLPSIDELVTALGATAEESEPAVLDGLHDAKPAPQPVEAAKELLSPQAMAPEQHGNHVAPAAPAKPLLVLLDAGKLITYPLDKETMTIGRADSADIRIDSHFISRIHARLVATQDGFIVEDVASKNGIVVNTRPTKRHVLRHGDLIGFGGLRFRYVDASVEEV